MAHDDLIPAWLHGLDEYQQMFDLTSSDLNQTILDFPGSISSFNAQTHAVAKRVVSGDALYDKSYDEMVIYADKRYEREKQRLLNQADAILQQGADGVESILDMWREHKACFLDDYVSGIESGRYQRVIMPTLPYRDYEFDLALCSDYVFNQHAQNDCQPADVVRELCRVAVETRIFPLLDEKGNIAESLGPVMLELQNTNHGIEIREVSFENLKGGNAMLRVWSETCQVK